MSGHTPGPWKIERGISGKARGIVGPAGWGVINFRGIAQSGGGGEANAHLIAAAPDLLAALEALVRINEEHNAAVEGVMGRPLNWKDDYLDAARAAIARARGEGA